MTSQQKQESDQVRLQMALSESEKLSNHKQAAPAVSQSKNLVDLSMAAKTLQSPQQQSTQQQVASNDPWGATPAAATTGLCNQFICINNVISIFILTVTIN